MVNQKSLLMYHQGITRGDSGNLTVLGLHAGPEDDSSPAFFSLFLYPLTSLPPYFQPAKLRGRSYPGANHV